MRKSYELEKPIEFDGVVRTEIELDLESLTGQDLLIVERQFNSFAGNQSITVKEYNKEYLALVAARASKLPIEFFQRLGAKDFSAVTIKVQLFFIGEAEDLPEM